MPALSSSLNWQWNTNYKGYSTIPTLANFQY
ncbi:Uncharacterised protein [Vibrio cholerae]|nr:Uncharacterised protein [Vibrio cholerae]